MAAIADGEAQGCCVREQLMLGASQIKMLAGGGVASLYDPLDSTQFTERELRAGVEAASDWNTYVMTHVYTPKGIQRAIHAGVKCIEHGQLADEASVRLMRDQDVWWSLQPFLQDEDSNAYPDAGAAGQPEAGGRGHGPGLCAGAEARRQDGLGHRHPVQPRNTATQGRQLAKLTRFYDPLTLLGHHGRQRRAAGAVGRAQPLPRRAGPHRAGRLGLLVADGDPQPISISWRIPTRTCA